MRLMKPEIYLEQKKWDIFNLEIESFYERNATRVTSKKKGINHRGKGVCDNCLKAHALNVAKKIGLDQRAIKEIENMPAKNGHNGFYLDIEEVVRCL